MPVGRLIQRLRFGARSQRIEDERDVAPQLLQVPKARCQFFTPARRPSDLAERAAISIGQAVQGWGTEQVGQLVQFGHGALSRSRQSNTPVAKNFRPPAPEALMH